MRGELYVPSDTGLMYGCRRKAAMLASTALLLKRVGEPADMGAAIHPASAPFVQASSRR